MARQRKSRKPAPPQRSAARTKAGRAPATDSAADRAAMAAVDMLNRGDTQSATQFIEQALHAHPGHPDLLHLAGQLALMRGDQTLGRSFVERAVRAAPDTALFRMTLGNVYVVDDRLDDAIDQFRRVIHVNARLVDAHTNLGIALARKGRLVDARRAFENAARLDPRNVQAQLNLAICAVELRDPADAETAVARVEKLVAEPDAGLLHQIGNIYRGLGRELVAQDYYEHALEVDSGQAAVWYALADVLAGSANYAYAARALQEARRLGYPAGSLRLAEASLASNRGDIDTCRSLLDEAVTAAGENTTQLRRIANLYAQIGAFDAQERCLQRVLELDPENVTAFAALTFIPGRSLSDRDIERLREYADDDRVDLSDRVDIGFALGNHFRHAKRFDDSFRYYRLGNRLKGYRFDRDAYVHWLSQIERTLTPAFFAERASWGSTSTFPLLIVGMPRSGTTLIEQVLSANSAIHGAGEYGTVPALAAVTGAPDADLRRDPGLATHLDEKAVAAYAEAYLARMRPLAQHGERHVANKLPHNFQHLGLFALLFPRAPIVHITRDPRDNLLSIYFQDFAGFHEYAYDLKVLGEYYRLYERLMAHWLRVIPNPVYAISYEQLVADLPGESRKLAAFVGVPWEEAMLRFYEQDRLVQTASVWQVRQKLYSSSVGRWKPYEKHLKPLFDALDRVT